MTSQEYYRDFQQYCSAHQNIEVVRKYSRYFKEGYDAWGLTQELMDAKSKEMMDRPDFSIDLIIEAAPRFFESGKYEETAIILSILHKRLKKLDLKTFKAIEGWFKMAIHNWAHADILGMNIIPEFILRKLIEPEALKTWLSSGYPFQRRCVPVSYIKIIKKGHSLTPLLKITEALMMDPERVVHQGVGWFLREAWKLHPEETEAFLLKWKDRSPRLIFQYACEKMSAEGKTRFRKTKSVQ